MESCEHDDAIVVYSSRKCPLCEEITTREGLESELEDAKLTIESLQNQ